MNVTEEIKDGVVVITLEGRLDANSSPCVETKVNELTEKGHLKILFNMKGVDYLSSAGMRVLLSITKKLKSLKGQFFVFGLTDNVMDIIRMAGFHQILFITSTEEDALHALTNG